MTIANLGVVGSRLLNVESSATKYHILVNGSLYSDVWSELDTSAGEGNYSLMLGNSYIGQPNGDYDDNGLPFVVMVTEDAYTDSLLVGWNENSDPINTLSVYKEA